MSQKYKTLVSGPVALAVTTIIVVSTVILGWRWGVAPVLRRRRRDQNAEFADYIFQERQKKDGESVNH